MAKTVRWLRKEQQEFQKIFAGLCNTRNSWQVWFDFIECAAVEMTLPWLEKKDKDADDRLKRHDKITAGYSEHERSCLCQLFEIVVNALEENPEQDFLGEIFMALELGNHWKGQFFTPYNICQMMARMQCADAKEKVEEQNWISINDPACGAGALLIAARNEMKRQDIGPRQVLFIAQDIDHVAGLMCFIQLSLLGCAGYVVIADTLCNPLIGINPLYPVKKEGQDIWFTPMFFDPVWRDRVFWEVYVPHAFVSSIRSRVATPLPATEEANPIGEHVPEEKPAPEGLIIPKLLESDENGQLLLF